MEENELITICPCGKSDNCFTSKHADVALCLDCGLTKNSVVSEEQLEKYPMLYKDVAIGNWFPYYLLTNKQTVFLDGESADKSMWVYLDLDENSKPIDSSVKIFNRYKFFDLFKFLQDKLNEQQ